MGLFAVDGVPRRRILQLHIQIVFPLLSSHLGLVHYYLLQLLFCGAGQLWAVDELLLKFAHDVLQLLVEDGLALDRGLVLGAFR